MQTEFEVKFLGVNYQDLQNKVVECGGVKHQDYVLLRRVVFAGVASGEFVRVRDEGDKIVMTYKNIQNTAIDGVKELNVVVDHFENTVSLLEHAGIKKNAYQESYRSIYELDGCEICFDRWPGISEYCEIEGPTRESVEGVVMKLGLSLDEGFGGPVNSIYEQELGFINGELETIKELSFANPPQSRKL